MAFTLTPRRWYAMLCILPDGTQHASPVWIFAAHARKTGAGLLEMDFWHANYPEGVQRKTYLLRVLRRAAAYLIAERHDEPEKSPVILAEVSREWLRAHFQHEATGDLQAWLDRSCPHP